MKNLHNLVKIIAFLALTLVISIGGCAKKNPRPYSIGPSDYPPLVPDTNFPIPHILQETVKSPTIRIGLKTKEKEVAASCNQIYYVLDPLKNEKLGKLQPGQEIRLSAEDTGITIYGPKNNRAFSGLNRVYLGSDKNDTWFDINRQRYRGFVELIFTGPKQMTVVNIVEVEEYLRGVVPKEIGIMTPETINAAKAQAIAARTYTFAHRGRRAELGFDLYGSVQDQVYEGVSAEDPLIDQAILDTRGIVATYQGQMIEAYYYSTCGGHTSNVHEVWRGDPIPYLQSVTDSPGHNPDLPNFCQSSKHYRWREIWTLSQLTQSFKKYLPQYSNLRSGSHLGAILEVRLAKNNQSRRNVKMTVITTTGQYTVFGDKIRWVMRRPGTDSILRSCQFDLEFERNGSTLSRIIANGQGNGHGVGMCQWGAIEMARQNYTFEQILSQYYKNIELKKLY